MNADFYWFFIFEKSPGRNTICLGLKIKSRDRSHVCQFVAHVQIHSRFWIFLFFNSSSRFVPTSCVQAPLTQKTALWSSKSALTQVPGWTLCRSWTALLFVRVCSLSRQTGSDLVALVSSSVSVFFFYGELQTSHVATWRFETQLGSLSYTVTLHTCVPSPMLRYHTFYSPLLQVFTLCSHCSSDCRVQFKLTHSCGVIWSLLVPEKKKNTSGIVYNQFPSQPWSIVSSTPNICAQHGCWQIIIQIPQDSNWYSSPPPKKKDSESFIAKQNKNWMLRWFELSCCYLNYPAAFA